MNMVKNNEQVRAETDQQKLEQALKIASINIASTMVVRGQASIDDLPALVRKASGAMQAGLFEHKLEIPAPAAQAVLTSAVEQPVETAVAAPAAAPAPAPVASAPAKQRKARKAAQPVAEAAPQIVEAPVKRPRGRPRKEVDEAAEVKGIIEVPRDPNLSDAENDAAFLAKFPPIMSRDESLIPWGDRNQMRLIFSGEPVSFLNKKLQRFYGRTFEEYVRIYGLGEDYPDKPPQYYSTMRNNAKKIGLGNSLPKVKGAVQEEAPVVEAKATKVTKTRTPKAAKAATQETPKATPRERKTRKVVAHAA